MTLIDIDPSNTLDPPDTLDTFDTSLRHNHVCRLFPLIFSYPTELISFDIL
jgi:hypothetical protein